MNSDNLEKKFKSGAEREQQNGNADAVMWRTSESTARKYCAAQMNNDTSKEATMQKRLRETLKDTITLRH